MSSLVRMLAHHIRTHGPVKSARVSSAQARGAAKRYPYWGATRYQIRLTQDGTLSNIATERASSDRRSMTLVEQDCDDLCGRESRVRLQRIGRLTDGDAANVLRQLGYTEEMDKHTRRSVTTDRPLTLSERYMVRILMRNGRRDRLAVVKAVRDGKFRWVGRWVIGGDYGNDRTYAPYGDDRDAAEFARETNQELRRKIYAACGDRVVTEASRELIQADDYGQLYRMWDGSRQVRVVCPSTGAVYWLPVSWSVRTAKEAVAETFGMAEVDYTPTVQA